MALSADDTKTIRQTVIRWGVLGMLAGVSAGALATYGYLRNAASDIFDPMPTKNAVIASLVPCDDFDKGWSQFEEASGRFIIGAGDHVSTEVSEYNAFGLEQGETDPRKKPSVDGAETVMLTEAEMPSRNHDRPDLIGYWTSILNDDQTSNWTSGSKELTRTGTQTRGGGLPHNNMPPYIALYFCKKD